MNDSKRPAGSDIRAERLAAEASQPKRPQPTEEDVRSVAYTAKNDASIAYDMAADAKAHLLMTQCAMVVSVFGLLIGGGWFVCGLADRNEQRIISLEDKARRAEGTLSYVNALTDEQGSSALPIKLNEDEEDLVLEHRLLRPVRHMRETLVITDFVSVHNTELPKRHALDQYAIAEAVNRKWYALIPENHNTMRVGDLLSAEWRTTDSHPALSLKYKPDTPKETVAKDK